MRTLATALTVVLVAACGDNLSSNPAVDAAPGVDAAPEVDAAEVDAAEVDAAEVDAPPPIDAPPPPIDAPIDPSQCTTTITAAQSGSYVELCAIAGGVEHVRITGVTAPAVHASAQLWFGFDAAPTTTTGPLEADQFRVLFYGGGVPAPAALVQASYGAQDQALEGDASFINGSATVCFDLHDGAADAPPYFVMWVDGVRGADCETASTLTVASAYGVRASWRGARGAIDKAAKLFYRQSAGLTTGPTITLFDEPVLTAAAIRDAAACATTPAVSTDWQPLCVPAAGPVRHVRADLVQSSANNAYFYLVLGQDPSPTGNPAASAGKLIITGGRSNSGSSWTWFRFDDGTTTQFSYANSTGALYTAAPSTICFDTGATAAGTARLVFWATGADGADCAELSTLTPARALYDSTTDVASGAIWDVPYVTGKLNFLKTNNTNATVGPVTMSSEAAAL